MTRDRYTAAQAAVTLRLCDNCGCSIAHLSARARTCSLRCRVALHRARAQEREPEDDDLDDDTEEEEDHAEVVGQLLRPAVEVERGVWMLDGDRWTLGYHHGRGYLLTCGEFERCPPRPIGAEAMARAWARFELAKPARGEK